MTKDEKLGDMTLQGPFTNPGHQRFVEDSLPIVNDVRRGLDLRGYMYTQSKTVTNMIDKESGSGRGVLIPSSQTLFSLPRLSHSL